MSDESKMAKAEQFKKIHDKQKILSSERTVAKINSAAKEERA